MTSTSFASFGVAAVLTLMTLPCRGQSSVEDSSVPEVIEDGGLSAELQYWMTVGAPKLRAGHTSTATEPANFDFPGRAKGGPGIELGIPAGKGNTLRFSFFRTQGAADTTATSNVDLLSVGYAPGDLLVTRYKMQNMKLSWEYLSYTFASSKIRFKTLYEVQYTSFDTSIDAPLKVISTDSSGNAVSNTGTGGKSLVYPTFGVGFEQALSPRFRWEAKTSGFGLPHLPAQWEEEASAAIRFGHVEVLVGERLFMIKTSPRTDMFFEQMVPGAYLGVRYYQGRSR